MRMREKRMRTYRAVTCTAFVEIAVQRYISPLPKRYVSSKDQFAVKGVFYFQGAVIGVLL